VSKMFRPLAISVQDILYAIVLIAGLGVIYGTFSSKLDAQALEITDLKENYKPVPTILAKIIQKLDDMSDRLDRMDRYNRGQKRPN
jgi:hypothetical protein